LLHCPPDRLGLQNEQLKVENDTLLALTRRWVSLGGNGLDREDMHVRGKGSSLMSVRSEVLSAFKEVAAEQQRPLAPLSDELELHETGLDSLCFAIIVARLEDRLGRDPFSAEGTGFPVTVGDLIKLYDDAS
jgi:acyl carrier protein